MIYARAYDQTVAEDYFTAMQRVEQRLDIVPVVKTEKKIKEDENVKVQERDQIFVWLERLALPELCQHERLDIAENLKRALSLSSINWVSPPQSFAA